METTVTCVLATTGMKGPRVDCKSDHHVHERDCVAGRLSTSASAPKMNDTLDAVVCQVEHLALPDPPE